MTAGLQIFVLHLCLTQCWCSDPVKIVGYNTVFLQIWWHNQQCKKLLRIGNFMCFPPHIVMPLYTSIYITWQLLHHSGTLTRSDGGSCPWLIHYVCWQMMMTFHWSDGMFARNAAGAITWDEEKRKIKGREYPYCLSPLFWWYEQAYRAYWLFAGWSAMHIATGLIYAALVRTLLSSTTVFNAASRGFLATGRLSW